MRILKRYNHNANHRLTYKYHKTLAPSITLDKYCTDGKHDPRAQLTGGVTLQSLQEAKLKRRKREVREEKERRGGRVEGRDGEAGCAAGATEVKSVLDQMYGGKMSQEEGAKKDLKSLGSQDNRDFDSDSCSIASFQKNCLKNSHSAKTMQ